MQRRLNLCLLVIALISAIGSLPWAFGQRSGHEPKELPKGEHTITLPEGFYSSVGLSSDGSLLLRKKQAFSELTRIRDENVIRRFEVPEALNVRFSPNGELLLVSRGKQIELYRANDYETPWRTYHEPEGLTWSRSEFSPDSTFLAILTYRDDRPHACTVLDLESGDQRLVAKSRTAFLGKGMALNRGGSIVALGSDSGDIRLWNIAKDAPSHTLSGETLVDPLSYPIPFHTLPLGMAFSPDGRYLAASVLGGHIKRWDAASGTPLASLAFPGGTSSFRFSSNGLLSVLNKGGLQSKKALLTIWQFLPVKAGTGTASRSRSGYIPEHIALWARFGGDIIGTAFSGDGSKTAVLTKGSDGQVQVTIYSTEALIEASSR